MVSNLVPAAPRVNRGPSLHLLLAQSLCWAPRRHLGGTSVGWPPVRVRIHSSDDAVARRRDDLVYKFTFDVANRRLTEACGCGETLLALGTPWFSSFFLVFRMYDTLVTVEAWAVLRDVL